jgi:hypothetical protein
MTTTRFRTSSASRAAACNMFAVLPVPFRPTKREFLTANTSSRADVSMKYSDSVDLIFGNVLTEAQRSQLSR